MNASEVNTVETFARELSNEFVGASLEEVMKIITDRGWNFKLRSVKKEFTARVWGEEKESYFL